MDKREFELRQQKVHIWGRVIIPIPKYLCIVACFYLVFRATEVLAGKTTVAAFSQYFLLDLQANKFFSHAVTAVFGAGGIAYGVRERHLKRKNIERMGAEIKQLETRLDPNRTSSRLTPRGTTQKEDQ